MPRHEQNEFSFDYPRDWEDRTVVSYSAPQQLGKPATNIVVTRDTLADQEDGKGYADRHLVEMAKRLDAFQLIERKEVVVDGEMAVSINFGWRGSGGALVQRLTMVAMKDRKVINITCTSAKRDSAHSGPIFDRIIASMKLGKV